MYLSLVKKCIAATVVSVVFNSFVLAAPEPDKGNVAAPIVAKITAKMNGLRIQVISVSPFAVDGLYELVTDKGIFYLSEDMQFLLEGSVYDLNNKMENISEKSFNVLRKSKVAAMTDQMIVYKAAEEKHVITVFTDTSCGYCQKLHAEMADYNKLGITVRYLAFPRGGLKSKTYDSMVSIWCADDPKKAMDSAKKRHKIKSQTCENTVKEQYELGILLGVKGTPAIILEDGSLQPGYLPANYLAKMLDKK